MPSLTVKNGPRSGMVFRFDATVVLGRGREAEVPLEDAGVSRRHAILDRVRGEWTLADRQSRNGTAVNGSRIPGPTRLRNGDLIKLGSVVLEYRDGEPEPARPPG